MSGRDPVYEMMPENHSMRFRARRDLSSMAPFQPPPVGSWVDDVLFADGLSRGWEVGGTKW